MRHAPGQKETLIRQIQIHRVISDPDIIAVSDSMGAAIDSTKGYYRKTTKELEEIRANDFIKWPISTGEQS